jgi:hypothetical protein
MTFLNPLVLLGLAAAAIPILIHLLNIRKLKLVDFSSLRFLKELQKTRLRRLKIRQWLILLLRTLLVIFLVLAFARPALKGSFAALGGGHASSTVVILLDNSPSMGTRNEYGVLFDQAREAAAKLLNTVTGTDEVYLYLLSDVYDPSAVSLPVSSAAALKAISGLTVTQRSVPYSSFVARGLRTLAASHNANKELCLITDGQGTAFSLADTSALGKLPPSEHVGVFLTEISPSQRDNGAASLLAVESRLLSPQKPTVFRGTITNFGGRPISNTLASLYLDGTRVAQQSITVGPHATADVVLSAVPKRRGILGVQLHIDDDVLDLDNSYHLVLRIPERIAITCIGTTPADTRYPALALNAAVDSAQAGIFAVQQTTRDRMQFADLGGRDVIVLSNIRALTPGEALRIADAVTSGRSLVIFPGNETDYEQLNKGLLSTLGIPAMTAADLGRLAPDRTGFATFSDVDYRHPIFEGMFAQETGKRGAPPPVESPRIRAAAGLRPGASGLPIISMSDGRPFLCEYTAGKGRVLIFAVESGTSWSDFPFKGVFAPLMHRSMLYLVSQHDPVNSATVGDRLRFSVRMTAEESGRSYLIHSPSGSEERVRAEQHAAGGISVFQSAPSQEAGVYALLASEGSSGRTAPMQALAVNPAAPESDLSRVDDATSDAFWSFMRISPDRIRHIEAPADIPRVVQESRFGVELWRYMVALALACALMEMALSRAGTSNAGKEEHAEHNH